MYYKWLRKKLIDFIRWSLSTKNGCYSVDDMADAYINQLRNIREF